MPVKSWAGRQFLQMWSCQAFNGFLFNIMSKIPEGDFHPLYYAIPQEVAIDKTLTAIDRYIYGTIYWLTNLRNKKCTASNLIIAKATKGGIVEQTVERGLFKLETGEHIKRTYYDKARRHRKEIVCLRNHKLKAKKTASLL